MTLRSSLPAQAAPATPRGAGCPWRRASATLNMRSDAQSEAANAGKAKKNAMIRRCASSVSEGRPHRSQTPSHEWGSGRRFLAPSPLAFGKTSTRIADSEGKAKNKVSDKSCILRNSPISLCLCLADGTMAVAQGDKCKNRFKKFVSILTNFYGNRRTSPPLAWHPIPGTRSLRSTRAPDIVPLAPNVISWPGDGHQDVHGAAGGRRPGLRRHALPHAAAAALAAAAARAAAARNGWHAAAAGYCRRRAARGHGRRVGGRRAARAVYAQRAVFWGGGAAAPGRQLCRGRRPGGAGASR